MAVRECNIKGIAELIKNKHINIILIYAFNGTGKTRLSMKYKDITKVDENHTGVYYNAYSEDLFQWDNDAENEGNEIVLKVVPSSLNKYHSYLSEQNIEEYLKRYNFTFKIEFIKYENEEKGIEAIRFYNEDNDEESIKISRGEERIFIWCFFLALFEIGGLSDSQNKHFYIDDPVSSLDENNIFITTSTIIDIIKRYSQDRKIIITTHHIGFFSMLINWLEYEKDDNKKNFVYRNKYKTYLLKKYSIVEENITNNAEQDIGKECIELKNFTNQLFLYHLVIINEIDNAINNNMLQGYHVVLLRQLLEYISSFIGYGNFSAVLKKVGFTDDEVKNDATLINFLSHKNLFTLHTNLLDGGQVKLFKEIFERIKTKYEFNIKKDNQTDNNPITNIEINNQNEGNMENEQSK